jgi:hypothetical protein
VRACPLPRSCSFSVLLCPHLSIEGASVSPYSTLRSRPGCSVLCFKNMRSLLSCSITCSRVSTLTHAPTHPHKHAHALRTLTPPHLDISMYTHIHTHTHAHTHTHTHTQHHDISRHCRPLGSSCRHEQHSLGVRRDLDPSFYYNVGMVYMDTYLVFQPVEVLLVWATAMFKQVPACFRALLACCRAPLACCRALLAYSRALLACCRALLAWCGRLRCSSRFP